MNKITYLYYSLIAATMLSGCNQDSMVDIPTDSKQEIVLKAHIVQPNVQTRGIGVISSELPDDLSVEFTRIDGTNSSVFPDSYANCSEIAGKISKDGGELQFAPTQYYPSENLPARMIGWYPNGDFDIYQNKVKIGFIDGSTDIMATPLLEGSAATPMETAQFSHLLTQIRIQVYATNKAVREYWGEATGIVLKDKKEWCNITLPLPNSNKGATADIELEKGNQTDLPLVTKNPENNASIVGTDGTSEYSSSNPLYISIDKESATLCGYAMFAPCQNLTIILNTTKQGMIEVPINREFQKGTSYVVTLKLDSQNNVSGTAKTDNWITGEPGEDINVSTPQYDNSLLKQEVTEWTQDYKVFVRSANGGFVGDPMPMYANGEFHVFYLHDARDGAPTYHPWYHTSTTTFADYNEKTEAIPCGADGTYEEALGTGSVIEKDGTYYAFYTGHNETLDPDEKIYLATSTDLQSWTKQTDFLLEAPKANYDRDQFRDPFIFKEDDTYHMLITTRAYITAADDWQAVIAQYTSTNLLHWTLAEPFYYNEENVLECPDYFIMGDYEYLVYSNWDFNNTDRRTRYVYRANGDSDWQTPEIPALDDDFFYAGKTASDGNNRYLFGWCATRSGSTDAGNKEWAGALVTKQLMQNEDGTLYSKIPLPLAETLDNAIDVHSIKCINSSFTENNYTLDATQSEAKCIFPRITKATRIAMEVSPSSETATCGILLAAYEEQEDAYKIIIDENQGKLLLTDSSRSTISERPLPQRKEGKYDIDLVIEHSVFTIYINGISLTGRLYSMSHNPWGIFCNDGNAAFKNIRIFQ